MKRTEFLKLSGLTLTGAAMGLFAPTSLFAARPKPYAPFKLSMKDADFQVLRLNKKDKFFSGWLTRMATGSLITGLGASLVDNLNSDCYCNGSTCSKNLIEESDYDSPEGLYGYPSINPRFLKQRINDRSVQFDNVSVPFLTRYNSPITHIEGPFLAGICMATQSLTNKYSVEQVRSLIVPQREISNGGSKFMSKPCYPTHFKTDYGSTEIEYEPDPSSGTGGVKVRIRDEEDNLDWSGTYDIEGLD